VTSVGPVEPIGTRQFFWLAAFTVVAGGVFIWPEVLVLNAGADAAWGLAASPLLACGVIVLQFAWASRIPGATYAERLAGVWGRLALPWLLGDLTLCTILDAALIVQFTDMLQTFFYPATTTLITRGILVGLVVWFAANQLTHLARNAQFWLPAIMLGVLGLFTLGAANIHEIPAILPNVPVHPGKVFAGLVMMWYMWMQSEVLVTLGAHVRERTLWQLVPTALAAIALQGLVLVLLFVLVVGTLGPVGTAALEWPLIYVVMNIGPTKFFVARAGILVMPTWVAALLFYLAIRTFWSATNVQAVFSMPGRQRWLVALGFGILLFGLGCLWPTAEDATRFVINRWDPFALTWSLVQSSATALLTGRAVGVRRRRGAPAGPHPTPA